MTRPDPRCTPALDKEGQLRTDRVVSDVRTNALLLLAALTEGADETEMLVDLRTEAAEAARRLSQINEIPEARALLRRLQLTRVARAELSRARMFLETGGVSLDRLRAILAVVHDDRPPTPQNAEPVEDAGRSQADPHEQSTPGRFATPEDEAAFERLLEVFAAFRDVAARARPAVRDEGPVDGLNPPAGVHVIGRPIDKAHYRATLARLRERDDVRDPFILARLAHATTRPIFMTSDHGELLVVDHGLIRPVLLHETEILAAYDRQTAEDRAAARRMADPRPGEVVDA